MDSASKSGTGVVRSKSCSLKSLLVRAWRERWSHVQFAIQLKALLPKGCSGDVYNLSEVLIQHAVMAPSPNALVLSYLRHCLAGQVIQHAALLQSIARYQEWEKPYCTAALLDLISSAREYFTAKGRPEDCLQLGVALLQITQWLLKVLSVSLEGLDKINSAGANAPRGGAGKVHNKNISLAQSLLLFITEKDFCLALMCIGKAEEKDLFPKLLAQCKQISDQLYRNSSNNGMSSLKPDLSKILTALKSLEAPRIRASLFTSASSSVSPELLFQPLLAFEVVLNPVSDLVLLSQQIYAVARAHGMPFSEVVFQIVMCSLGSLFETVNFDSCKWDAFLLIKLPVLLDKLASLMRVEVSQLRTPTEVYKAFDKLLKNDGLLDAIDVKCECDIVDILLGVVQKANPPLMTPTEKDDVFKKRQGSRPKTSRIQNDSILAKDLFDVNGTSSNSKHRLELLLKMEESTHSILRKLDVDSSRAENMEGLLEVLSKMGSLRSYELLLAASSANGNLRPLLARILSFNQQFRESVGESVKNSLLRAALFDVTFLMLVYAAQVLGADMVLSEANGTFMESWIRELMLEEGGRMKDVTRVNPVENIDTILQQWNSGDFRTQVVFWQNVCMNAHQAMKEIVIAREENQIDRDTFLKLLKTASSKLCAIPVCIMTWFLSFKSGGIDCERYFLDFKEIVDAESHQNNGDVPHRSTRLALMKAVMAKMEESAGRSNRIIRAQSKEELDKDITESPIKFEEYQGLPHRDVLLAVWRRVARVGRVDHDSVWALRDLLTIGGATWLVGVLIDHILKIPYQEDLERQADLLIAVLHIDLEACTLALLLRVVPKYLTACTGKVSMLTDPHGSVLAKVIVACAYSSLVPVHLSSKNGTKSTSASIGQKRPLFLDDIDFLLPEAKNRRLSDGEFLRITTATKSEPGTTQDEETPPPVAVAVTDFFKLLHGVVQEPNITPVTHFAIRLLEQAYLRGGGASITYPSSTRSSAPAPSPYRSHSRLLLTHLNPSTVLHLSKLCPHSFPLPFITQLYDIGVSSQARKNAARVICLLGNYRRKKEVAKEKEQSTDRDSKKPDST